MFITKDPLASDDAISMTINGTNHSSTTTHAQDYEDPLADVFGSDSSPSDSDQDLANAQGETTSAQEGPSDITRLRRTHVTNGYRDGIGIGKEQTIQAGFDEGYALGAEFGIVIGRIIGVLEGLLDMVADDMGEGQDLTLSEHIKDLTRLARERLTIEKLFGPPFFDETGLWTFPITSGDKESTEVAESEITFRKVAASHPTIIEMSKLANDAAKECGLSISDLSTQSGSSISDVPGQSEIHEDKSSASSIG